MFKKKSLTASSLGIRVLMGGYLLYLSYSLILEIRTAVDMKEMLFMGVFIALFLGVGATLIFFSIKAFVKGDYDKGNTSEVSDMEKDEGNIVEEENILKSDEIKEENDAEVKEETKF